MSHTYPPFLKSELFLLTDQSSQENFAKSAASIASHNFHWNYATLVLFNSILICNIDIFLRSYQKNVIVGRGLFYPGFVKRVRQYVIFGADLTDILHTLDWMQRHHFDNTGKYILVCLSEQQDRCDEIDVVNALWNYKILNVVLINRSKGTSVRGFTYYQPEDCKNTRPTYLKNWDPCLLNGDVYCQNMYPPKLKNLHCCPITVSMFDQVPYMNLSNDSPTGADGVLLRVIAEAMNFTLGIMTPRIGYGWGKFEDNGTWTGSLADVYNEWANFSMTSASMTLTRFTTFQVSKDYAFISIVWVTHPSDTQPSSFKLFRPLQTNVRIALGVSFVMVVLFKFFFKSKYLATLIHEVNDQFTENHIFHSWAMCMGVPVSSLPTNKALLCLTIFWIWYCLLIRTLYQEYLINSLQTDVFTVEFDTIEEAIELKYNFGGGLALREYYIYNDLVYDEWKNVESDEIYPTMVKLSHGLKFVMAMNVESLKMFLSSHPDKKLHVLPQIIVKSPSAVFFKKYSPLVNPLNIILSRLRESGIIQKIYMDNTGKKILKDAKDKNISITMVHFTGCYAILFMGWLLSATWFLVEKLINQKGKN